MLTISMSREVQVAEASGTIYIRADGSVQGTDKIVSGDNVTYTFTDNINDSIVVERDNIVVDGAGYTLQGTGAGSIGMHLVFRNNVTIRDIEIKDFQYGVILESSSDVTVSGSHITDNGVGGIQIYLSSNNMIFGNNITANNDYGIAINYGSSNNSISENDVMANSLSGILLTGSSYNNSVFENNIKANNWEGIYASGSFNNYIYRNDIVNNDIGIGHEASNYTSIVENNITANFYHGIYLYEYSNYNIVSGNNIISNGNGIWLSGFSNNRFYHNNLVDNTQQVHVYITGYDNTWDDGYPSGGNYWSDYVKRYPDAEELNGSGLWDTAYVIDGNNQDRYPLMYPYGTQTRELTITATSGGTTTPPPGIHTYLNGTVAQVMALPDSGYSFSHWRIQGQWNWTNNPVIILVVCDGTLEAFFVDETPPDMSEPVQDPLGDVELHQNVTVTVNVTDFGTGVHNVTLYYSVNNGTTWTPLNMTETAANTYQTTIQGFENCTRVTYKIVAYDNAGNNATKDNNGYGYIYYVIPEFPSVLILPLCMTATFIAIIVYKRKRPESDFVPGQNLKNA